MHFCMEAEAWDLKASCTGSWNAVAKRMAEVFCMWYVLDSLAAGWGRGGALVLTHGPRAGMQLSQKQVCEDVEDTGASSRVPFSRGRREGLIRDSPVGPL